MGKRFSLVTEYSEAELQELIISCINKVLDSRLASVLTSHSSNTSPPDSSQNELLSRKEVCKLLRISLPTLAGLQKKGEISFTIVGGSYRYGREEINKFLERKSTGS